jgi:hypothetical protein
MVESMTDEAIQDDHEPEIAAISRVYLALKDLDEAAQHRVLDYVSKRLNLSRAHKAPASPQPEREHEPVQKSPTPSLTNQENADLEEKTDELDGEDALEGVSPGGKKWMRRNGLDPKSLSAIFSLGIEEIDLIAKKVPGRNKKDRMRSVFLLKGVASYLSSGTARFKDDDAREACNHYDAHDTANFAAYLKSFSSIFSGTKAAGYTLTSRGIAEGTELVKEMLNAGPKKASA